MSSILLSSLSLIVVYVFVIRFLFFLFSFVSTSMKFSKISRDHHFLVATEQRDGVDCIVSGIVLLEVLVLIISVHLLY
jgi:hypothetical protein